MTITAQPLVLPEMSALLSGYLWNTTSGTAQVVTYDFLTAFIGVLSGIENEQGAGDPPLGTGWAPLTAAEQALSLQVFASISAVCNLTFQSTTDASAADIIIGTDNKSVNWGLTGAGQLQWLDDRHALMSQMQITVANNFPSMSAPDFIATFMHEVQNSTGVDDGVPGAVVSLSYPYGPDQFSPGGWSAVTPQIAAIAAWQYLYGVNQNGYTAGTDGTTEFHAGNNHTYAFSSQTAPTTIWVGANVSGVNCFDFSACGPATYPYSDTGIVTIDLTPGTFSSTGTTAPDLTILSNGQPVSYGDLPYENVAIAYGTVIQIGIANNIAGATLIADATTGHADLLIGGTGQATFVAGDGTDIFLSRGGNDSVQFHDPLADYKITANTDGELVISDIASAPKDHTVLLAGNFTSLVFTDQTVSEAPTGYFSGTGAARIADSAADVSANLDTFQAFVAQGYISGIDLTDAGIPVLSLTAAQTVSDAQALAALPGGTTLLVNASAANAIVVGEGGAHATIVDLPGTASAYTLTSAGDGVSFTLSFGSSLDHFSNVTEIVFSNDSVIVASQTASVAGGVSSAQITALYAAALGREPDAAGLAYYENLTGTSLFTFSEYFLSSPEYREAHTYTQDPTGDAAFITDLYQDLLNRAPEAGAVDYYLQKVVTPILANLTPGTAAYTTAELQAHATVLAYVSQSPEFLGDVQITSQHPADAQHWLVLI